MYTNARRTKACLLCLVLLACPAHTLTAQATVFRCTVDGVVTFSDRPCGHDAAAYESNLANVASSSASDAAQAPANAGAIPSAAQSKRAPARADSSIALEQAKHADMCARLEQSLREIRSKMRSGYDLKQGERLRERQRRLREQSRLEKC